MVSAKLPESLITVNFWSKEALRNSTPSLVTLSTFDKEKIVNQDIYLILYYYILIVGEVLVYACLASEAC